MPHIWADKDYPILHGLLKCFCATGEDGIYTPYFIAYFPTRFKDKIGSYQFFSHINILNGRKDT